MVDAPDECPEWDCCAMPTAPLNDAERRVLGVFLKPDEAVPDRVCCELAAGHDGDHVAFLAAAAAAAAAGGGDRWWWLAWTTTTRVVYPADPCDRAGRHGGHEDDCLLPRGHPGPDSFELRPPPGSPLPGGC